MTLGHTRLLATQTDERLLELVQQGHERAFEAIVARYRRPLLAYCRRLGLSDSRAEDVLQQALLKSWLALQAGVEVRALRPWLYRIVHNAAVNVMRSSRDELAVEPSAARLELLAAPDPELEHASAARQALTHVAALPSMQRDAILLSAIDGRTHDEVAQALGISSGAVRGLLYRARTALRAAAAALTPAPLINWASGTAGRAAPTAGRLAELTGATSGAQVGGVLLKGAAVAGSALLAAGVVLGPLHGRAASGHGRLAGPSATVNGPFGGATTYRRASTTSASSPALTGTAGAAAAGAPATHTGTSPTVSVVTPVTGHSGSPAASAPAPPSGVGQTSPTSTSSAPATATAATTTSSTSTGSQSTGGEVAGGSAGGSGGGSSGGSGGGSSGGSETEGGKHSGSSSDDGSEGEDGGQSDDAGGSDRAEHEREAAQERAEEEAEAARERAEREAEIAREHEHHAGKDS